MTSNRVLAAALAVLVTGLVVIGLTIAGVFSDGSPGSTAADGGATEAPFGDIDPADDSVGGGSSSDPADDPSSESTPGGSGRSGGSDGSGAGSAGDGSDASDGVGGSGQAPSPSPSPSEEAGSPQPSTPSQPSSQPSSRPSSGSGTDDPGDGSPAARTASVIASSDGVVRRVGDQDTQVSDRPATVAFGVDDLVAYQPRTRGQEQSRVRVWSPRGERQLALGDGAERMRLLGAGALEGRPVALVSEDVPGERPQEVTDRLVAVDLRDGSRTVYASGDTSFESGWTSAHLLAGGDLVATRQSQIVVTLVRLAAGEGRQWQSRVAEDRPASLAAVGDRLWIVGPPTRSGGGSGDGGATRTLRVAAYDAADGSRSMRDRIELDQGLESFVRCRDWLGTARLVCATGGAPVAVTARGGATGAVEQIDAPDEAVVTAVATTG